eukprot:3827514-Pyramimonas_sp.AAC.1
METIPSGSGNLRLNLSMEHDCQQPNPKLKLIVLLLIMWGVTGASVHTNDMLAYGWATDV